MVSLFPHSFSFSPSSFLLFFFFLFFSSLSFPLLFSSFSPSSSSLLFSSSLFFFSLQPSLLFCLFLSPPFLLHLPLLAPPSSLLSLHFWLLPLYHSPTFLLFFSFFLSSLPYSLSFALTFFFGFPSPLYLTLSLVLSPFFFFGFLPLDPAVLDWDFLHRDVLEKCFSDFGGAGKDEFLLVLCVKKGDKRASSA